MHSNWKPDKHYQKVLFFLTSQSATQSTINPIKSWISFPIHSGPDWWTTIALLFVCDRLSLQSSFGEKLTELTFWVSKNYLPPPPLHHFPLPHASFVLSKWKWCSKSIHRTTIGLLVQFWYRSTIRASSIHYHRHHIVGTEIETSRGSTFSAFYSRILVRECCMSIWSIIWEVEWDQHTHYLPMPIPMPVPLCWLWYCS